MFVRPPKPARLRGADDDLRPWSERFRPLTLDELAVHKKKVADVRRWIEGVLSGQLRQRILLLKGAAGTGKTTTVNLLAEDLGCELLEWKSPLGSFVPGMQSPSAQFEAFLGLGGKFGGLELEAAGPENQAPATHPSYTGCFETLLTTTSSSADSFTAHRLLGPEIMRHPGTGLIEFNAIAPSLLSKALELVVLKEARKSGRRRTPGPEVLKRLGDIGDIRSAISSLEFLCLKGDQDADWGAKISFTKPKRGAKSGIVLTRGESESLEQITQREASLGIFHAVGKVVYNKRDEPLASSQVEALPSFLRHHARPKRSQVAVDSLIDEIGSDTATFISALHENYALSSISFVHPGIPFGGRGAFGIFGRDTGSHIVRQDEMAFQVAVRGMLFALPHPVKRIASGAGRSQDSFKMFYPTSLKLWRAKEEMEGLVDCWSTKLLNGEDHQLQKSRSLTDGASLFLRAARNHHQLPTKEKADHQNSKGPGNEAAAPLLSLGSAARCELLLERLPYMALIGRARRKTTLAQRDLEKIVSFRGIGTAPEDESLVDDVEEGDGATGETWATDRPTEDASPKRRPRPEFGCEV
ncbi:unnamed protein product [Parascedosporium putredinis]|uniref:Checkpoint protein RAD24-like helical bundle domain-containing protein n=1 Tax=Parascedosporium putredinis TaxID=1442378 RepID=A0A9P1H6T2_9PEZI|nr:unnamed protein product [Parascedosporium putredinis]CAI7997907.1 unnamed protein product [Parascedosporium putredinis]